MDGSMNYLADLAIYHTLPGTSLKKAYKSFVVFDWHSYGILLRGDVAKTMKTGDMAGEERIFRKVFY